MKPFFSIRIEYNPADCDDRSHRDSHTARIVVARETSTDPEPGQTTADSAEKAAQDDLTNIAGAIVKAVSFIDRIFTDGGEYNFMDFVIFGMASSTGLMSAAIHLAEVAADGGDEDFLDRLQKVIDEERKKGALEA